MQTSVPTPGAQVRIRQRQWTVRRARLDRSVLRLDVASGGRRLTFLAPFDRPIFGPRRPRFCRARRQHAIARIARALGASHAFDMPTTAVRSRLALADFLQS